MKSSFIISLDFELIWGMHEGDLVNSSCNENINGGRKAIPALLKLFEKYEIHATWAVVGLMFAENVEEARKYFPSESMQPAYKNINMSPYPLIESIGKPDIDNVLYFAPEVIKQIAKIEGQEIASHTFSHFYCTEPGATIEEFKSDMESALCIAKAKGYDIKSVIFPKNLYTEEHIEIAKGLGLKAYRGLRGKWLYGGEKTFFKRCLRLLDTYIPITGNTCSTEEECGGIYNICDSMMYRPFFKPLFFLEWLKIYRIKCQMKYAAKKGLNFHLWWHPHNIGVRTGFHLKQLEDIFSYFEKLKQKYGMESYNMGEVTETRKK